jgi:predicted DCC family thiol-disulfide oxidoreductase YuxK
MTSTGTRITVYYDGWCPLCRAIRQRLERIDWLKRLALVSVREAGAAESLGVEPQRLAERMHVRDNRTGKVVDGIDAVAAVAAQVPALWPAWPLLLLASRTGLGQPLYDFIARRRTVIPVGGCEDGACPIHRE